MRAMARTASTGWAPTDVSCDSITASVPSQIALATSEASARVGRLEVTIDSSISVAVITGTPVRPADERQRHVVDADLDRKLQVGDVLVCQRRQRRGAARHRHALALAEQPAAHDGAHGAAAGDGPDRELDTAVVEQHAIALPQR